MDTKTTQHTQCNMAEKTTCKSTKDTRRLEKKYLMCTP